MKNKKINNKTKLGFMIFGLILILAILIPLIIKTDPFEMTVSQRLKAPSASHVFGTDEHGRDLFIRVVYGARVSLTVGFCVTAISIILGTIIGLYASSNKVLDHIFMRVCDGLMSIPAMLLAISLMSAFGASVTNVITALVIVYTPSIARIIRSVALKIKNTGYVASAKVEGASVNRILWKHIFPNTLGQLAVQASYIFASSIISEASLSFLGAGIPAPTPSWGSIIQSGKNLIFKAWWLVVIPSMVILLVVVSLNLIGEGLRDSLDPKFKNSLSLFKRESLFKKAEKKLAEEQK